MSEERERKKRKYSNYGMGLGFWVELYLHHSQPFFNTSFGWPVASSAGGFIGVITGIVIFKIKNK